ncbi:hypothetical protein F4818DRAFT_455513 [Hypoxylon cercidicola]|nr:hypothetical protein F4818DRAFT_455513 [Hypoxylon cercidicola]
MSEAQREAKAEAAKNCSWRGDSPEPEFDDLAEDHQNHQPDEVCSWQGDSPEPELDDLAHHSEGSNPLQRSRAISHVEPRPKEVEQLYPPKKRKGSKKPEEPEEAPEDQVSRDQTCDAHSGEQSLNARPRDNRPANDEAEGQEPDETVETLREKVTHGIQQAFSTFQSIIKREPEAYPSASRKPCSKENDKPESDKKRAKGEKKEAKKAQKEKKVKEKEEKKRLKKEKKQAKKQKKKERKEQRRKEKAKKNKGKAAASPPPDLPPGANVSAAAGPHPHPGCKICENPEEQGTVEFLRQSLENWQGLPSFHDLTEAAKKLLGRKGEIEPHAAEEPAQSISLEDQQLIDHIAEHVDTHIRHFLDPKQSAGANAGTDKALPHSFAPHPPPSDKPAAGGGKKQESRENGSPVSHGLDGNRDWPMTITRGHNLRGLKPASPPKLAVTQSPSPGFFPFPASMSRSVSPWCEQLGLSMDEPRPFPKRAASWSRRG